METIRKHGAADLVRHYVLSVPTNSPQIPFEVQINPDVRKCVK